MFRWSPGQGGVIPDSTSSTPSSGFPDFLLHITTAFRTRPRRRRTTSPRRKDVRSTLSRHRAPMTEQRALNRQAMTCLFAKYPNLADPEQNRQYIEDLIYEHSFLCRGHDELAQSSHPDGGVGYAKSNRTSLRGTTSDAATLTFTASTKRSLTKARVSSSILSSSSSMRKDAD